MKERPLFPIYDIMEHWAAFAFTTPEVRPVHHALYHALVYMCKRRGGAHRFNLPTQEGMSACGIAARNTYTAALRDLESWGFVIYTPGANGIIAPIVDVKFCASTEQALSSYRSSHYAAGDATTEHIIKEVKRLKEEDVEKSVVVEGLKNQLSEREKEIEDLKADLDALREEVAVAAGLPTAHDLPTPAPMAADKAAAIALTDPGDEQPWQQSPVTRADSFRIICDRVPLYIGIAYEHYRHLALATLEGTDTRRTVKQWQSWIHKFLTNQTPKGGKLLTGAEVADQSRTGVHAPQSPDAPNHKRRPEVQAQYDAQFEAQTAARIAANFASRASETGGSAQQPGSTARGF